MVVKGESILHLTSLTFVIFENILSRVNQQNIESSLLFRNGPTLPPPKLLLLYERTVTRARETLMSASRSWLMVDKHVLSQK